MKRLNRRLPWILAWLVVLFACVCVAFFTKASYTDYASNRETLLELPYRHGVYSAIDIEKERETLSGFGSEVKYLDPNSLIDEVETIVECEFGGERTYSYQAFLSQVNVVRVLKGNQSLAGTKIPVFEPMSIWIPPGIESRDKSATNVQDNYMFGSTMMVSSKSYVLFLENRQYSRVEDRAGKPIEYVICRSPYAKLSVDSTQTPETSIAPKEPITLAESLSYEILASDTASAQYFFDARHELLKKLKMLT